MDIKTEIARLRSTAKFLENYPGLGEIVRLEAVPALVTAYPNDRLAELLTFLTTNEIPFEARPGASNSYVIEVEGVQFWFSALRIEDLEGESLEQLRAVLPVPEEGPDDAA